MSTELTLEQAALAWAQGKRVEAARHDRDDKWIEIDGVGKCEQGTLGQQVFGLPNIFRFRLAPEPPAKKWRPWTRDEVPIGAIIKAKGKAWRSLILGVTAACRIQIHDGGFDPEFALENHVHSLDNGKTWLPCGVEVSE